MELVGVSISLSPHHSPCIHHLFTISAMRTRVWQRSTEPTVIKSCCDK